MGVVVKIGKQKAFLRNGEWRSADPELEETLNSHTRQWIEATGGPSLKSRDPELEVARALAERTGGRVLRHAQADRKEAAQHYLALRQTRFDFA